MKDTIKTTILVGFAFIFSFCLLYLYVVLYNSGDLIKYDIKEEEIHGDSIFLLGRSYVERIDTQFVKDYLSAYGRFVNVYHPMNAMPSGTLLIIDDVIKNNPQVVVLGVGFTDIGLSEGICNVNDNVIDDISEDTKKQIKKEGNSIEFDTNRVFTSNPKHITVELFRHYLEGDKERQILKDNVQNNIPLAPWSFNNIVDINTLNGNVVNPNSCLDSKVNKTELDDLRTIIQKLKENNIRVILFVPPFTKAYLESIPTHVQTHLIDQISQVAVEYDAEFYDLSHKYETSNIFSDITHVAHNPNSAVYSKDIAQIILKNIQLRVIHHIDVSSIDITRNSDLSFGDLSDTNLSKMDLSNVNLMFSNLENANITSTNLSNSNLRYTNLHNAILKEANLVGADLSGTKLVGVDLTNMDLSGTDFSFSVLTNSNLSHTILTQGNFANAKLQNTNITNVVSLGTIMNNADFTNANMSFSNFQGSFFINATFKDAKVINSKFSGAHLVGVDFIGADLSNSTFNHTELDGCINNKICKN